MHVKSSIKNEGRKQKNNALSEIIQFLPTEKCTKRHCYLQICMNIEMKKYV